MLVFRCHENKQPRVERHFIGGLLTFRANPLSSSGSDLYALQAAVAAPPFTPSHTTAHARRCLTFVPHGLNMLLGADDIQAVVDKLHVPHPSRNGVDAIITDLDPKVNETREVLGEEKELKF